ncbi:hypothetical protein [Lacticaseibacillus yichunensis]|uniref:Uncharacterized protein n=1 Tax=Lacticaseibacillus yichunensis TaxID=2486015 RepID=A0ABW4CNJ2_9LACO|nr:hypothetical protein [Lacticaseibacillus yichunensis]
MKKQLVLLGLLALLLAVGSVLVSVGYGMVEGGVSGEALYLSMFGWPLHWLILQDGATNIVGGLLSRGLAQPALPNLFMLALNWAFFFILLIGLRAMARGAWHRIQAQRVK